MSTATETSPVGYVYRGVGRNTAKCSMCDWTYSDRDRTEAVRTLASHARLSHPPTVAVFADGTSQEMAR